MSGRLTLIALAACVASATQAQQCPPVVRSAKVDFSKVEIKTTRHADDFFTLEGHGGTISVLTGPDGVFMVDGQFAPLTDKIVAAIRKVSDQPIRFLVNTHVHADHADGGAVCLLDVFGAENPEVGAALDNARSSVSRIRAIYQREKWCQEISGRLNLHR